MFKILLDAGHGAGRAHNRGGTCYNEGDNNYHYSLILKRELEKIKGVKVGLTRNKISDNPSLANRARQGAGYDLFLSLHSNGAVASVRGTEIYDSVARPNKALADKLVKAIANEFGHRNRGTKYRKGSSGSDYYGVLRGNKAKSSMIIEHGFHSNSIDCQYFKNNHQGIAQTTANVIAQHYNLKTSKPKPTVTRYGKGHIQNGKGVTQVQKDLKYLGYDILVRGGFGDGMEAVVKRFQDDNGITRDGIVGPSTLKKISQLKSNQLRYGSRGKDVEQLEKDLQALGYNVSPSGAYGKEVENAVKQFQKDTKIEVNGRLDLRTERRIRSAADNIVYYKVIAGTFTKKDNAKERVNKLKDKGFEGYIDK